MYIRCYYDLFKNMLILFLFCFFSRLIQTWNIQRLIGGVKHWNKIWMSTSTVQKTWLFVKKKKSTTCFITRNYKSQPHCQHQKSEEISNWKRIFFSLNMHLNAFKFTTLLFFFKYIKYCFGGLWFRTVISILHQTFHRD